VKDNAEKLSLSDNLRGFSAEKKYHNIYYQKVGNREYIFRLLTKGEYLSLYFIQFHINNEAEDILLEKCVLYPGLKQNSLDSFPAGEAGTLIDKILSLSGFTNLDNIKEDLDKERENIKLLDNQIVLIICKAFPHITPSDIDNFDYPTILHYVTLAEELLGTKLEISKLEDQNHIDFDKENKQQGFIQGVFPGKPIVKT
jgi:hypothetical protein